MQAVRLKLWLFTSLLAVVVACQPNASRPVPPTRLLAAQVPLLSTPTLGAPTPPENSSGLALVGEANTIGDPYIPELGNRGYDVQSYDLQLALNPRVPGVKGRAEIEVVATEDNLTAVSLDFIGFEISGVSVNDLPVSFSREAKKLLITLPQPVLAGTRLVLAVSYQGVAARNSSPYVGFTDSLGLSYVNGESIYTLSEPDGARNWFPANDHPRDKALFRFEITVPIGLTAVANGRLVDIKSGELESLPGGGTGRTFVWEHAYPMAPYLAVVAVGPFQRIDAISPNGVPLRHYTTAPYRQELETTVAFIGGVLDWMSGLFGPYPFEAFGYVAADLPPTAMETQTMVIMSYDLIGKKTAVHELAHMWFGDWVSLDSWSEMWRKEGFATYITLMWETGDDPAALDQAIEEIMAAVAQNKPQYPIDNPPPEFLLGYNTYFQGAAFIHALRREMGDEAFFKGVRNYLQQYGGRSASDDQFRAIMEAAAGRSLQAMFDQWLN